MLRSVIRRPSLGRLVLGLGAIAVCVASQSATHAQQIAIYNDNGNYGPAYYGQSNYGPANYAPANYGPYGYGQAGYGYAPGYVAPTYTNGWASSYPVWGYSPYAPNSVYFSRNSYRTNVSPSIQHYVPRRW
ncbi:MAG: hypothetical protein QM811_07735 [Pirellulales bacterium]